MSLVLSELQRRMVPRWRDFRTTILTGELGSYRKFRSLDEDDLIGLQEKIFLWQQYKSIGIAADLVSAAFVLGERDVARDAAEFVLSDDTSATISVKSIAEKILESDSEKSHNNFGSLESETSVEKIRARAHLLKSHLLKFPRNSVAWIDLARLYVLQNQNKQAKKSIESALFLSPQNRFVIRSATRFFLHLHEPDRALHLLNNFPGIKNDPWVLSAEIATSTIAESRSRNIKIANRLVENRTHSSFHLSELASSLATLELIHGSARHSKKLFNMALAAPTDNSVAQAEWAVSQLKTFNVEAEKFDLPRTYEARARREYRLQNWTNTIEHASSWLIDEPFASRPAVLGSYIAAVGLEDYELCGKFSRIGLMANPQDFTLRNNLVVSLAHMGRVAEAKEKLENIDFPVEESSDQCIFLATTGLLHYRDGDIDAGRFYYRDAIDLAEKLKLDKYKAMATIFFAKEELRIDSRSDTAKTNVGLVKNLEGKHPEPEIEWLASKLLAEFSS